MRPVVNFINILLAAISPIFLRQKITKPNCTVAIEKLRKTLSNEKGASKMLIEIFTKLTLETSVLETARV
jgi:hypothetical protein